jgi:amino acid adenylation domain-containing protein
MNVNELIKNLAQKNIKLSVVQGTLHISAAKRELTPELRSQLKHHKPALMEWLQCNQANYNEPLLPTIVPDVENRYAAFPLSDLQVGFYMADDPYLEYQVRPHYYMEFDRTNFDVTRYEEAWNKALQRHRGEMPLVDSHGQLQLQRELTPIKCRVRDLCALPMSQVSTVLQAVRQQLMRQELPLDCWPWFELQISRWQEQGEDRVRVHYNHNNFFCDGYGAVCLLNEVERYYAQPTLTLAPRQLSFRDAVMALDALATSELGRRAKNYWLGRLLDLPGPPDLPQISGIDRRCRSHLQRRECFLPAASWQSFKDHAACYGLTPSNAVVAAYAEILCAWSDSQHFVLSHMMTRRMPMHTEINDMLGNFASLYPLEVELRGDLSFSERAGRLQKQVLQDAKHLHWGGMQVMQALNRLKGELGRSPYPFVVGSGLFMGKYQKPDFTCLETSQTLLDHQFWELDDGRYYYVWDLLEEFFPAGMIDSMWEAFETLLHRLAQDKSFWQQTQFSLAPSAQSQIGHLLDTATPALSTDLLQTGLNETVSRQPDKIALVTAHGSHFSSLTYSVLDNWSGVIAAQLHQCQWGRGDLVAVVADRSQALVAATLGILKAGAAYVPVDPSLPAERLHYMLTNSQAHVVLTQNHYRESLQWPEGIELICIESVVEGPVVAEQASPSIVDLSAGDLAYVIYTSGSTGQPKGVMIDHRAAMNTILDINRRFKVNSEDRIFGVSSFSFDLSVYDLFGSLAAGATFVYPDPQAALNPAHWLDVLQRENITLWNSAPPLMRLLVETAQRQSTTLPHLRLVLLSGDWIPTDLPQAIKAIAPGAQVISLGGATEAAIWSIFYPIEKVDPACSSIPYGYPLSNQGWKIRDSVGRDTPLWTSGELYISGVGLAQGYWREKEKTAHSFIEQTQSNTSEAKSMRLYRTGDRGRYLPDGSIEFMGRLDSQVKIQGHRIELAEVESALQQHTQVKQAIVLAQGDRHNRQLVAFVEWANATSAEESTTQPALHLQDFLQQKLPGPMVPTRWSVMDTLPMTANGKIDRNALMQMDSIAHANNTTPQTAIAPRNSIEKALENIWQEVLKDVLPDSSQPATISVNEDFFELGGQSFDAVRSLALIKEQFGKTLSLGHIWQDRCIEKLAQRIAGSAKEASQEVLVAIETSGQGHPCYLVHPAGGQVMAYLPLAQRLAQPVYGFVAFSGQDSGDDSWEIKQLAAKYIKQMRQNQPHGPYTIGGWSSGGVIAFEMVAQLEKMGEAVDPVWMLDCPAPLQHDPMTEQQMLCGFIDDLALDLPLELLRHPSLTDVCGVQRLRLAIDLYNREKPLTLDVEQLANIYSVFSNIVNAGRRYRPGKISADIKVIRAQDGVVSEFADHPFAQASDWGWQQLTTGNVCCVSVPGSHYSFLNPPNVDGLVENLASRDLNVVNQTQQFA